MNDYTSNRCPMYSVSVTSNGVADFSIKYGEITLEYEINLKDKGLFEGEQGYSPPHSQRHFICHEDGEMIATPGIYTRLIYLEYTSNNSEPKVFVRARQWEWDWWMSVHFPESANAKVYRMIEEYVKFENALN